MKRETPTYEVKTADDLTKYLCGVLKDLRRGDITVKEAEGHAKLANSINGNNKNYIKELERTKDTRKVAFFIKNDE